ncbi:periplasmic component of amino acid ABC-type transporter/signal transduction system [Xenococcus sp. PCC 7305]|uniref:transporter substrate-binding domain-containing protein n=1 Tax=Xenococcus sp. PCC 7305 TaxID=102125 RepID=UPI0002ABEB69|nr:transporter substrate-binding domain-containing protein [Xenococcus sp. PCC 7305]ELS01225.1 periplasmic component of amino acid ABC-type transporter/signal transduction system [Xenococcus sp. PCC 7305]
MFKFNRIFLSIFLFAITISSETLAEPLRVGVPVKDSEPFVIQQDDKLEGMMVDIWEKIAQEKAIDYEWVPQDNYETAIDAVNQGDLDIFLNASITPERLEKVEFTLPIGELEIVVVTQSQPPTLWDRIRPFLGVAAISSLIILVISVFIVGNLIWLAERKANSEHFPQDYGPGLRNGMWFAMVTLTTVGYGDFAPVTNLGRLVSAVWMLITLLALSSITAGLASAITVSLSNQSKPRFSGVEDLQGAKIATVSGWSSAIWADYYGADTIEVATYEEAVNLVVKNKAEGLIDNDADFIYHLGQNPELNLSIANFSIATDLYGFALPFDSELTHELDAVIMRMRQDGDIKKIEAKWFP